MKRLAYIIATGAIMGLAGAVQTSSPAYACAGALSQGFPNTAFTNANPTIQQNGQVGFWAGGTIVIAAAQPGTNASGPVVTSGGRLQGSQLNLGTAVRTIDGQCGMPN